MTKAGILKSTVILMVVLIMLYIAMSLLMNIGRFTAIHYFSYDNKEMYKEKGALISDQLEMKIEGDSLKSIANLNEKFYLGKSMYQEFYGFLIHLKKEDPKYRRLHWDEPIENARERNWTVYRNSKNVGEAFFVGFTDAKIGDTVILEVRNRKPDYFIGTIEILIE